MLHTLYHTTQTLHHTVTDTIPHYAMYRTPDNTCTMLCYTTLQQNTKTLYNTDTMLCSGHQTIHAQCYTIPHYALDRTAGYTSELVSCLYYTMLHYTTLQYRHYTTLRYVQDNRLHTRICSLSKPSSSGEQLFQYTDMQSSLTN